jgi:hypothetical protein
MDLNYMMLDSEDTVDNDYFRINDENKTKKKFKLRSDDFEPNLGKVIDTLKKDYPLIFFKPLDYDIYIDDIEVSDPTGIAF